MTYLEKVMQAVKLDKELLTAGQVVDLNAEIRLAVIHNFCPGDFFLGSTTLKACRKKSKAAMTCWDCWYQEAEGR